MPLLLLCPGRSLAAVALVVAAAAAAAAVAIALCPGRSHAAVALVVAAAARFVLLVVMGLCTAVGEVQNETGRGAVLLKSKAARFGLPAKILLCCHHRCCPPPDLVQLAVVCLCTN